MSFEYRGLTAVLDHHTVTEAEAEHQLRRLLETTPRIQEVNDRPTQNGDEVVLDYAGFCDGVQFPGGTAQFQTLVLGSGTFIPGFEEQLLDKVPGEEVSVFVTFPEAYHSADLAGKAAEFKCKIHAIRVKSAYEMDDVFAKEVGGCENLEQMKEKMRAYLQNYSDEQGEMQLQEVLMRKAADTLEFTPTEEQIQEEMEEQMQNLSAQLAQQGVNLQMYCQFMNTTEEKLRADTLANAIAAVRVRATIDKIVELENLEATEEEMAEAIAVIARQNRMSVEQLKPYIDAEFEAAVNRSVLTSKAMKLVRDEADVVLM